jgi:hypothetical protein
VLITVAFAVMIDHADHSRSASHSHPQKDDIVERVVRRGCAGFSAAGSKTGRIRRTQGPAALLVGRHVKRLISRR